METPVNRNRQPGSERTPLKVTIRATTQRKQTEEDLKNNRPNEDVIRISEQNRYVIVCDGMGKYAGAADASRIAAERIGTVFDKKALVPDTVAKVWEKMTRAFTEATDAISAIQDKYPKCGTTVVVAQYIETPDGKKKAIIGSVGDSRVYLYHNNLLQQITEDDSGINGLPISDKEKKKLNRKLDEVSTEKGYDKLNIVEKVQFDNRYGVTQALNGESFKPHLYEVDIQDNDVLLLTSDGIHDNLTPDEIKEILRRNKGNETAALVAAAQARAKEVLYTVKDRNGVDRKIYHVRRKPDDMTAAVMRFEKDTSAPQPVANHQASLREHTGVQPVAPADIFAKRTVIPPPPSLEEVWEAIHERDRKQHTQRRGNAETSKLLHSHGLTPEVHIEGQRLTSEILTRLMRHPGFRRAVIGGAVEAILSNQKMTDAWRESRRKRIDDEMAGKYKTPRLLKFAKTGAEMIPLNPFGPWGIGDLITLGEAVGGHDLLTGRELDVTERVVSAGAALVPVLPATPIRNFVRGWRILIEETLEERYQEIERRKRSTP